MEASVPVEEQIVEWIKMPIVDFSRLQSGYGSPVSRSIALHPASIVLVHKYTLKRQNTCT